MTSVPERPPTTGREVLNEAAVPALETYFLHAAAEDSVDAVFDLPVALAILRLYTFFPHLYKLDVVRAILGMALGEPSHEAVFTSCRCLLSDVSEVMDLVALAEHLDCARFAAFWRDFAKLPSAPWKHTNLSAKIRRNIFDAVARTYDTIAVPVLASYLTLSAAELTDFLAVREVTVEGNLAKIPRAKYPNQSLGASCQATGPTLPSTSTIAAVLATVKD